MVSAQEAVGDGVGEVVGLVIGADALALGGGGALAAPEQDAARTTRNAMAMRQRRSMSDLGREYVSRTRLVARVDRHAETATMTTETTLCAHLMSAKDHKPNTPRGCEECLKSGDRWVHLRLCLQCGHVGCCDDSPNRHATKHYRATKHPVIRSFEPGETWRYCYADDLFVDA